MNTEAWHGKIMGPEGGLRARAKTKRNSSNDVPEERSNTTAKGNASSNAGDATMEEEAPHQATDQVNEGGVQEE